MGKIIRNFSWKKRLKSFSYAFAGIKLLLREEHNALIHLAAAITAIIMGFAFKISMQEWIAVVFAIGVVFSAEMVNTAIEHICNYISPMNNAVIKKTKDLAAGAVLIVAITALVVALIIFVPKIAAVLS